MLSGKLCEIGLGCKLVLFTNRKSHAGFRLVLKSVILNDIMTADRRYLCSSWASCCYKKCSYGESGSFDAVAVYSFSKERNSPRN